MLRKLLNLTLLLPLALLITTSKTILSGQKHSIDEIIEESENKIFIDFKEIEAIIYDNEELKSLKELEISSSFNLSSKISQKYPSIVSKLLDYHNIRLAKNTIAIH